MDELPQSLKAEVLAAAARIPAPPRTDRRWKAAALILLAVALPLVALQLEGGIDHAAGRPFGSAAWIVAGCVLLAAAASWLTLPPRRSMLSPPSGRLLAVALGVPLALGVWLLLWHGAYDDPFARVGARCFRLTVASAPWPFLALAFFSRRRDPSHPLHTGAALGAAAGAWGAVIVELWCPLAAPAHVAVGHVAPLVALSLAGAAVGARLFRLRPLPKP